MCVHVCDPPDCEYLPAPSDTGRAMPNRVYQKAPLLLFHCISLYAYAHVRLNPSTHGRETKKMIFFLPPREYHVSRMIFHIHHEAIFQHFLHSILRKHIYQLA